MDLESLRIIAGLILILFIPGYALTWAFYPEKKDLSQTERLLYHLRSAFLGNAHYTIATLYGYRYHALNIVILIMLLLY